MVSALNPPVPLFFFFDFYPFTRVSTSDPPLPLFFIFHPFTSVSRLDPPLPLFHFLPFYKCFLMGSSLTSFSFYSPVQVFPDPPLLFFRFLHFYECFLIGSNLTLFFFSFLQVFSDRIHLQLSEHP